MQLTDFIKRAEALVIQGEVLVAGPSFDRLGQRYLNVADSAAFRSSSLSFIRNVYGENHPYFSDFEKRCSSNGSGAVKMGVGIMRAIRDELDGGWFRTVKGLAASEVFADFIELSEYLLNEGHKDAAAVILCGTLEVHLRQLAAIHGVSLTRADGEQSVPKNAATLNDELRKAGAYGKSDQKLVTLVLDLRNKAAHGSYGEYEDTEVATRLPLVKEFFHRVPAEALALKQDEAAALEKASGFPQLKGHPIVPAPAKGRGESA